MLTVEDCIKDLNRCNWYESEVKETGILKSFLTVKKYENLFYKTHSNYSKNEENPIIEDLCDKIEKQKIKTADIIFTFYANCFYIFIYYNYHYDQMLD